METEQQQRWASSSSSSTGLGLLELPQVVLSHVGTFLPKGELLGLALVAKGGDAFAAEIRALFLTPAPLLEDPEQPTVSSWPAYVDRHAACLERLLRRLPRYVPSPSCAPSCPA